MKLLKDYLGEPTNSIYFIRTSSMVCLKMKLGSLSLGWNIISEGTFSDVFLFRLTFRSPLREHHHNSNAFLVCENKNETSKKYTNNKLLWRNKEKTYCCVTRVYSWLAVFFLLVPFSFLRTKNALLFWRCSSNWGAKRQLVQKCIEVCCFK